MNDLDILEQEVTEIRKTLESLVEKLGLKISQYKQGVVTEEEEKENEKRFVENMRRFGKKL